MRRQGHPPPTAVAGGRNECLDRAFPVPLLVRDGGGHLGELPDHWAPRHAGGQSGWPRRWQPVQEGCHPGRLADRGAPERRGHSSCVGVGGQEEEGSSGLGLDCPREGREGPPQRRTSRETRNTALCSARRLGPVPFWADMCGVPALHRPACCPRTSSPLTPTLHGGSSPTQRREGGGASRCRAGQPTGIRTEAHSLNPQRPRNLPCILGIVPPLATWRRSSQPLPGTRGQAHTCRDALTMARKGLGERGPHLPGGRVRG